MQLSTVDLLIFDIQDVGARYYTYAATMALCMQAAKAHGKKVIITVDPDNIRTLMARLVTGQELGLLEMVGADRSEAIILEGLYEAKRQVHKFARQQRIDADEIISYDTSGVHSRR